MTDDDDRVSEEQPLRRILAGINEKLAVLTTKSKEISTLNEIAADCADIVKSQTFLSEAYEKLKQKWEKCSENNKQLRSEVTALTTKCTDLSRVLQQIKTQLNSNGQAKLSHNVLIRGFRAKMTQSER